MMDPLPEDALYLLLGTRRVASASLSSKEKSVNEASIEYAGDEAILDGQYYTVLARCISDIHPPSSLTEPSFFASYLADALEHMAEDGKQYEVVHAGAAALLLYCQANWTGPELPASRAVPWLAGAPADVASAHDAAARAFLATEGEEILPRMLFPSLLAFARIALATRRLAQHSMLGAWWHARACHRHALSLTGPTPSLRAASLRALMSVNPGVDARIACTLAVELAQIHLYYHEDVPARRLLDTALVQAGVSPMLDAALGVRTRYQVTAYAQMYLRLPLDTCRVSAPALALPLRSDAIPAAVDNQDDTLLQDVKFNDPAVTRVDSPDPPLVTALLMCDVVHRSWNTPDSDARKEEIRAYLRRVLSHPVAWSAQTQALFVRSTLESKASRTVERALTQVETLVAHTRSTSTGDDSTAAAAARMALFFPFLAPSRNEMLNQQAALQVSLGMYRSALEVAEYLDDWELVIQCHRLLEQPRHAEAVIRQRLAQEETPALWTVLGDVTQDNQHYHTAWDLSQHKYARAMRQLGFREFKAASWAECVEHLQLALDINPMYPTTWFYYAYAALKTQDWPRAARGFLRVVMQDPEHAEAWANLATVYIQQNKLRQALRALREACKRSRDNWKIWDNLTFVAAQQGAWSDALSGVVRTLELSEGKRVDAAVIEMLVDAAVSADSTAATSDAPPTAPEPTPLPAAGAIDELLPSLAGIDMSAGLEDDPDQDEDAALERAAAAATARHALDSADATTVLQTSATAATPVAFARQLTQVLVTVTSAVTDSPMLWRAFGRLQAHQGKPEAAFDCHQKQARSAQLPQHWPSEPEAWEVVAQAAVDVADAALAFNNATALYQARTSVQRVVSRGKAVFQDRDDYASVAAALQRVKDAEAVLRAASS